MTMSVPLLKANHIKETNKNPQIKLNCQRKTKREKETAPFASKQTFGLLLKQLRPVQLLVQCTKLHVTLP